MVVRLYLFISMMMMIMMTRTTRLSVLLYTIVYPRVSCLNATIVVYLLIGGAGEAGGNK